MQVDVGAVLGVFGEAVRAEAGTGDRLVHRQEDVAVAGGHHRLAVGIGRAQLGTAGGQQVDELQARRHTLASLDDRAEEVRIVDRTRLHHLAAAVGVEDQEAARVGRLHQDRRGAVRVEQRHLLARHRRRRQLHVAADGGRVLQVGMQLLLVFDDRHFEVVVTGGLAGLRVDPLGGRSHRQVAHGAVGHGLWLARQRQRIDELAQRAAGVAGAVAGQLAGIEQAIGLVGRHRILAVAVTARAVRKMRADVRNRIAGEVLAFAKTDAGLGGQAGAEQNSQDTGGRRDRRADESGAFTHGSL